MRASVLEIQYKTPEQIRKMRAAGLLVAATLERLRAAVVPGVSTAQLDALAEQTIRAAGGVPSFLGYHGYPASICSSVNDQVVHAIPSARQVLRDGDLISIDCGAALDGWHGDAAITVPVGDAQPVGNVPPVGDVQPVGNVRPELLRMARAAEDAMWAGIAAGARAAATGRGRLTDISHAIALAVRAAGRYGIVSGYGGHGIGTEMHQDPDVPNLGRPGKGPRLVPGLVLAIEPMITMGGRHTVELDDGWTVVTRDGSVAAHVEHTVAFCQDGVWVLTARDGGRQRLGDLVSPAAADLD